MYVDAEQATQLPLTHLKGQTLPHVPQLLMSLSRFLQTPEQHALWRFAVDAGHVAPQLFWCFIGKFRFFVFEA